MSFSRALLIGQWFRSDSDENNNHFTEYAQLLPDGSFEFTFITHDKKGEVTEETIELGDWGLVGDIHFTITKSEVIDQQHYAADLNHEDNYHAYQVIQLNDQILKYRHIVSNEVFILRRVVDKIGYC